MTYNGQLVIGGEEVEMQCPLGPSPSQYTTGTQLKISIYLSLAYKNLRLYVRL